MPTRQVFTPLHFFLVMVLCLSVVCQVIGVPIALYNLAGIQEIVESPLLESTALMSTFSFLPPQYYPKAHIVSSARLPVSAASPSIFHPPISSL